MSAPTLDFGALSVMERLSLLPPDQRAEEVDRMSEAERASPEMWLRPDQLRSYHDMAPTVAMISGRGAGKTRVGSSWTNRKAAEMPGSMGHLIGRTVADVRDVMVRGDSGIIATAMPGMVPVYIPSLRRLEWPNGSVALTFSSEKPAQLRGPQSHWSWVDEMAALNHRPDDSGATTWDNLRIGTRLGAHPQIFVTSTPKRIAAVRDLIHLGRTTSRVSLHGASTFANRAHLSAEYLRNLRNLYAGTALERQELYGELVEIVPGALWRPSDIAILPEWLVGEETLSVVGVDPGLTTGGNATGIVTVRTTTDNTLTTRRAFVMADYTEEDLQPERWAARVVEAWRTEADATGTIPIIVAEKNAGGELVASVIEAQAGDRTLPVALVPSTRSKAGRAEAIVVAYRQGRVVHADEFVEMVLEMCVPGDTWVETARGPVQMQDIVMTDRVLTRAGYAPIAWSGMTGTATELWGVSHSGGTVYSTGCHPVWTETRGFVPARTVTASDLLLVGPVEPASRWRGEDDGGLFTPVTATTRASRGYCIAPSGRRTSERSRLAGTSTTSTATRPTIASPTSDAFLRSSTTPNTPTPGERQGSGGSTSLNEALAPMPCGPSGNHATWCVDTVGSPSCPQGCEPCSARPVAARSATRWRVVGSPVPVFNLMVVPGHPPEFFANGILVHNCEWEPPVPGGSRGSGWSPNRLDALVIALRACLVDDRPLRPFGKLTAESPSEVVEVPYDRWRSRGASPGLDLPWRR